MFSVDEGQAAPDPAGGTLQLTVRCFTDPEHTRPRTHRILLHPDWSVDTGHDLEAERFTLAFGGYLSCFDLAEKVVPAVRTYVQRQLRRTLPAIELGVSKRWHLTQRVDGCCAGFTSHPSAALAAEHARSPRHVATEHGARASAVRALGKQVLAAHGARDPLAMPREALRLVQRCVATRADAEMLWEAGLPPELVETVHAVAGLGKALPANFYLGVLSRRPDLTWIRDSAAQAPGRDVHEWLAWTESAADRALPGRRGEWLGLGLSLRDVAVLSESTYQPSDVEELARGLQRSTTSAGALLANWVHAECFPSIAALVAGAGKTAVLESAGQSGWHVETLIVSHHEASDFAGLPVVGPGGTVTLAPPAWAQRLAEHDGPSLAFFDEWTTASPSVQAAALRPLTHHEVGALQLPATVSFGAAANPADVAAGGWELAPPTANRFCHLDWDLPLEVFTESIVTGQWPVLPVLTTPAALPAELARWRVLLAGYLRARQTQLSALPKDALSRGRAFPTPRTWSYAVQLAALSSCLGLSPEVHRLLVFGCVGAAAGHEFLVWAQAQDLPDPEDLLADPGAFSFVGLRPDRLYVVLQAVLSAVMAKPTAARWETAVELCAAAARADGLDAAVPVVRALVRPGVRPTGANMPPSIRAFAGPLTLAGLMPGAA